MRPKHDAIIASTLLHKRTMLWSIRNQILLPLVAIQAVAVATVAVTAATLAARRSEQQIISRINGVADTLGHSNFPYTAAVLTKMRAVRGALRRLHQRGPGDGRHLAHAPGRSPRHTGCSTDRTPRLARRINNTSAGGNPVFCGLAQDIGLGARFRASCSIRKPVGGRRRWEAAAPPLAVGLGTLGLMAAVTGWIAHRISHRIHELQRQAGANRGR